MRTEYVNLKSELTRELDAALAGGLEAYRTRTICACRYPNNRRNAVLCAKGSRIVKAVIRCKQCAKEGGAQ